MDLQNRLRKLYNQMERERKTLHNKIFGNPGSEALDLRIQFIQDFENGLNPDGKEIYPKVKKLEQMHKQQRRNQTKWIKQMSSLTIDIMNLGSIISGLQR